MLVAHRGASADAPENTLAAFDLAIQQQADAIECDVRLTADRVPVIFHDETLGRIGGGFRRIADLTYDELQEIDAGAWKGPEWTGIRIPSLDHAFAWSATGLPLIVELKAGDDPYQLAGAVVRSFRAHPQARLVTFSSFSLEILSILQHTAPDLPRAFITSTLVGAEDEARLVDASAIHAAAPSIRLPLPNLPVGAWTVDDPAEAVRLRSLGVTTLFSNRPCDIRHVVPPRAA